MVSVGGGVDAPQLRGAALALPVGEVALALPYQMDDAGLVDRLREDGVDRLGKPVSPSVQTKSTSLTPRLRSSVMTLVQKRAPSVFSIQSPRQSRVPSSVTPIAT
jgi:hypothetical protein